MMHSLATSTRQLFVNRSHRMRHEWCFMHTPFSACVQLAPSTGRRRRSRSVRLLGHYLQSRSPLDNCLRQWRTSWNVGVRVLRCSTTDDDGDDSGNGDVFRSRVVRRAAVDVAGVAIAVVGSRFVVVVDGVVALVVAVVVIAVVDVVVLDGVGVIVTMEGDASAIRR